MNFSDDVLIRIAVFALGFCGFLIARHIYKHKKADQSRLVCPLHFDCDAVVNSNYSKLLGVPVEIFGMIYYGLISVVYIFLIFSGEILPNILILSLLFSSLFAFLFSLYLICVQIFILKQYCFWCIISAVICIIIFTLTLFAYDMVDILSIFTK